MRALEPTNPFVEPLVLRLDPLASTSGTASKVVQEEETLAAKMDRVSIAEAPDDTNQSQAMEKKVVKADADAVWRALQEEERSLRRAYKTATPKQQQRRPRSIKSKPTAATDSHGGGEISKKTDALWALLGEEEASTVAKAFSHSTEPNRVSKPN